MALPWNGDDIQKILYDPIYYKEFNKHNTNFKCRQYNDAQNMRPCGLFFFNLDVMQLKRLRSYFNYGASSTLKTMTIPKTNVILLVSE